MKTANLPLALEKLKEAEKLEPDSEVVANNLGTVYANMGMLAAAGRNFPLAEESFRKAIPYLERSPQKTNLIAVLRTLSSILNLSHKPEEAAKIEAKLRNLEGH
jgi:tetratricopeptide (TPR) repeat protein